MQRDDVGVFQILQQRHCLQSRAQCFLSAHLNIAATLLKLSSEWLLAETAVPYRRNLPLCLENRSAAVLIIYQTGFYFGGSGEESDHIPVVLSLSVLSYIYP